MADDGAGGGRAGDRLSPPPTSKILPPSSLAGKPLFYAHAHKTAVVDERENRGARSGGTDEAGLNSKRAPV